MLDQVPESFSRSPAVKTSISDYLNDWAGFEPVKHGVPALELLCATLTDLSCEKGSRGMATGVGGFVRSTVITAERVDTEIVRVWDDRVGEKISPDALHQAAA